MKTLKKTILIFCLVLFLPQITISQDSGGIMAYWIHEDQVKPSMIKQYEQVTKDLVANCNKYNIQNLGWLTVAQNDNTYLYITPIKKFADLDKNYFATLSEKMGAEAMSKLFTRYNICYDKHGDYVIYLMKELSYMPNGISQVVKGKNYRKFYYNYVTPENDKHFMDNLKKIKELFTKKNSKMEYRIYKSGFGLMGTFYMVAIAAENGENFEKNSNENWKLMGDEFLPLLDQMNKYTLKGYEKSGWMRTDLAYKPK